MNNAGKYIIIGIALCFLALCSVVSQVEAAEPETAVPLLCAFTKSMVCDSDSCASADLEVLDLPPFFKVDLNNKLITDVEALGGRLAKKKTPIEIIVRSDDNIILQGVQLRAWSILISKKTGKFTLTASDDEEAAVFFGACTSL